MEHQMYDLTPNELRAAMVLVESCFSGMGGKRPSDLEHDEYTWVDAKVLMAHGWSKNEAAGTFGALMEKGLVEVYDKNEWCLATSAWQYLDTLWDAYNKPQEMETAMTCVTIDIANLKISFHETAETGKEYADQHDFLLVTKQADLEEGLTGPQMVALYNTTVDSLNAGTPGLGLQHVNRFSGKEAGAKRVLANLLDLWNQAREDKKNKPAPAAKAPKAKAPAKPASTVRRGTGINLQPQKKVYACRAGSKQALLVDLLSRAKGATMAELLDALSGGTKPWKEVTVKSGLNWDMNKVKGYGIRTTKRGDDDCYHLVLPAGMDAPLPHTPMKGKAA